jgi:MerR family mercuric resistance operon transcriptional regulator
MTNGGVVMSARIRIGELSRRTGCNIETIRYYERIGLLPAPVRSAGRYRLYDTGDLQRLSFIRRARDLGFTLDEVRSLVSLSAKDEQAACASVRELAESHLVEIRAKIADLRAMERVLTASVRRCAAREGPGCPILDVLHEAPTWPHCEVDEVIREHKGQ